MKKLLQILEQLPRTTSLNFSLSSSGWHTLLPLDSFVQTVHKLNTTSNSWGCNVDRHEYQRPPITPIHRAVNEHAENMMIQMIKMVRVSDAIPWNMKQWLLGTLSVINIDTRTWNSGFLLGTLSVITIDTRVHLETYQMYMSLQVFCFANHNNFQPSCCFPRSKEIL